MNKGVTLVGGAGLGAGLMYLLDPDKGRRRRALVRDQVLKSARTARGATEATVRDTQHRTREIVSSIKSWVAPAKPSTDRVLAERVRSKLGMIVRHPRSIDVAVQNGTVTLSGPILADEVDALIRIVARVPDVTNVDNQLEVHEDATGVPGLQREEAGLLGWGESATTMYGPRPRILIGIAMTVLGVWLLARILNHRDIPRRGHIDISMQDRLRRARRRDTERPAQKRLREVMTGNVKVIHPDATLDEAATKMKASDIGALPVCDGDRVVGMLTDRDIVIRVLAEGRNPKEDTVRTAMTPDIAYGYEDDDVQEAAMLMADKQIRRLVVLNRDKRLVGIVSLGDIAVQTQDAQLGGEVLEYVSEPTEPQH